MRTEVQGNYRSNMDGLPVTGNYRYVFLWRGSMERDNGDYILYQGGSELFSLKWHEAVQNQVRDLSNLIKPEIIINYVVRKGDQIHFDFNIRPVVTGSGKTVNRPGFHFPQSAEHEVIEPSVKYNRGVHHGSNEIAVPEEKIYVQRQSGGPYIWDWRFKNQAGEHRHSVRVELKVIRRKKA